MKNVALCVVFLLALPSFAQIVDVQNNSNFACSGMGSMVTCQVNLNTKPHTTAHNLIAVWTFWQSASTYTASVADPTNPVGSFLSAVGPTLQSVSSPAINAQIFYAKNINASAGADTVTVTFTGPTTGMPSVSGGAVAVEYKGLDLIPAGNTFTASGCTASSLSGGPVSGKFNLGSNSACAITITMGNSLTAKNGWSCWANDETHAFSVGYRETATTTTSASILMTGTLNDVIDFGCAPY